MTKLIIKNGDLLKGGHNLIVNAVNCVGVMGAGVAMAIRRAAGEEYFECYKRACDDGALRLGGLHVWDFRPARSYAIVNFPTMHVPGGTVNPAALRLSMLRLRDYIAQWSAEENVSLGIPALGCGIGDFQFHDLIPIVKHGLDGIDAWNDVTVTFYQPW